MVAPLALDKHTVSQQKVGNVTFCTRSPQNHVAGLVLSRIGYVIRTNSWGNREIVPFVKKR